MTADNAHYRTLLDHFFSDVTALMKEDVEVDFLGATSARAIHGILITCLDFDFDAIEAAILCRLCL